jgi:sugar/nucleoside kinase (ribokinase family)
MGQKYDVAGMGNAIVDVIGPADDAFLLRHAIAKGVMTLIDEARAAALIGALADRRVTAGGSAANTMASLTAGGSAANTMAGLASLGGTGLYVGRVKDDELGRSFAASMRDTGIHYDTRMATSGASTACCLIAVTPDGQRSMSTYLGASRELAPSDIDDDAIASARVLYIEGYLWDAPDAKAAIARAIGAAKRGGAKVALTLSDPFCVGRYRDEFLALLRSDLDIVFANEDEAKALFEVDEFDDVFQAMRPWPGIAALTRSEKGCVIAAGDEVHVIDAAPVAKVVDTTGAGDQFAAAFLYGLTHGKGLADSGRLGSLAAAEVISHYGARPEVSLKDLARKAGLL